MIWSMDRKGIGEHLPDPRLAVRIFSSMPDDVQQLIKLNVVGGFQTMSMKAKWDTDVSDKCPFCGECDTREHRLLHCPVGLKVRENHASAVDTLRDQRQEWVYIPLPRQHDMCILLRAYLKLIKPPVIPVPFEVPEDTLRFFTDGGSIHPACASARIASWAVIQDTAGSDSQRRDVAAFINDYNPKFPCFKVVALGIVHGEQTVARGELFATLTAVRTALRIQPIRKAVFYTDAKYVCCIIRLITTGLWRFVLHKLPNCDLVEELAQIWRPDLFTIRKVKSHRKFESAVDFNDLWEIAGNFCADLAATSALRSVPSDIRKLADEIAGHTKKEETLFRDVLHYLADFNKVRCEAMSSDPHVYGGPSTSMQIPRCPPQVSGGLFQSNLMGDEAATFLKNFHPDGYCALPSVDCDDSIFSMCLQGVNVSKAVKLWLETLLWPPDVDCDDASDWGASWFELAVSFYMYTGFRFPVRIGGAGNKSRYADYGSDEALILPGHQRAAVLQGICSRNAIQTLSTVMEQKIFPTFKTFKCRILTRFGMKGVVAGVPRRPIIPNPCETMDFVVNYVSNMTGLALNEPIFVKDLQPTLLFDRIPEISAADRHNRYASFMKGLRKRNACAALDDDN